MNRHSPFFTVLIPTYNRPKFLYGIIKVLLKQTFDDFEIIIADNSLTEETYVVAKKFICKKIRYFRTGYNIGLTGNLQKTIKYAKGKYILFLGDDDFLLYDTCLYQLHDLIKRIGVGFVRLNLIDQSLQSDNNLHKKLLHFSSDVQIPSNLDLSHLIYVLDDVVVGMLTGIVLKNTHYVKQKLLFTENTAWFPLVYETVKHFGGYFASNIYLIITWSVPNLQFQYPAYRIRNSRLDVEPLLNYCIKDLTPQNKQVMKKLLLAKYIQNIPSIKLYTNNINCIQFIRRVCVLEPSFTFSIRLWILLIISCILPKWILVLIRSKQHKMIDTFRDISNKEDILKRYYYLRRKYFTFT